MSQISEAMRGEIIHTGKRLTDAPYGYWDCFELGGKFYAVDIDDEQPVVEVSSLADFFKRFAGDPAGH